MNLQPATARLGISGTLEYRDKDGNVLKTVGISGSVPLTADEAQQIIDQQEAEHGTDIRE